MGIYGSHERAMLYHVPDGAVKVSLFKPRMKSQYATTVQLLQSVGQLAPSENTQVLLETGGPKPAPHPEPVDTSRRYFRREEIE